MSEETPSVAARIARDAGSDLFDPHSQTGLSRPAFDRARDGHPPRPDAVPEVERPPRHVLPDPKPSYAENARNAERLWFVPVKDREQELSREEFLNLRKDPVHPQKRGRSQKISRS